jgi:hypothetical protein
MYVDGNPKSKKQLKEWVADPNRKVTAYQPGGIFESQTDGRAAVEGPHYPQPHRWYASVLLKDGEVVKVIS